MRLLGFTCFLGLLLLCSCEDFVDLDISIPEVVIETRVQAGKSPEVTVRVVDQYGQTLRSFDLESSVVTIQQEDLAPLSFELLASSDSSATFTSNCIIESGMRYTLLINSPELDEVRSITEVPDAIIVKTQDNSGETGPNGGLLPEEDIYYLPISFQDEGGADNFFHIVVTVQDASSVDSEELPIELNFGLLPPPSDARRFNDTGWMFSDSDFEDGIFSSDVLILKEEVIQYEKPVVTIELRTVSIDYFNFHVQSSRPKSNTLPNRGISGTTDNIAGGIGFFGGYSSNASSYSLDF